MIASLDGTALTTGEYLGCLGSEGSRFREALVGVEPATPVPTCEGWTVADLVEHLAAVYAHKSEALRSGARPADGSWSISPPNGVEPLKWFDSELASITDVLGARSAGDTAWSWWPPDQSVGFWQRRMAQESMVHRVDAEASAGAVSPVDARLAVDGVDELLGWMAFPFETPGLEGGRVRVTSGGHAWIVQLDSGDVKVRGASVDVADAVDAEIHGAPGDLLLYLWGRHSVAGPIVRTGAPEVLAALDARLAATTD